MSDSISTTYGSDILIQGADVIIGTAMLGNDFGTVKSMRVKRGGNREALLDGNGNLRANFWTQLGFEATLEVAFDASVTAPGIGEKVTLPLVGVVARVMEGAEVAWEQGGERGLSIPLNSWDSLPVETAGLYSVDPVTSTRTLRDLSAPVITVAQGDAGELDVEWADITGATGYVVQVSDDAGSTWAALATPSESTYTHTGLGSAATRHYRVAATNTLGQGPWSNTGNATTAA